MKNYIVNNLCLLYGIEMNDLHTYIIREVTQIAYVLKKIIRT